VGLAAVIINSYSGSSTAAGQKNGQFNQNRDFWGSIPKSAVVGFRISQQHWHNVGWIECNETQQSLEWDQPNLQNAT
jgi:hypothetical protein